jgi:hypothetical protein
MRGKCSVFVIFLCGFFVICWFVINNAYRINTEKNRYWPHEQKPIIIIASEHTKLEVRSTLLFNLINILSNKSTPPLYVTDFWSIDSITPRNLLLLGRTVIFPWILLVKWFTVTCSRSNIETQPVNKQRRKREEEN